MVILVDSNDNAIGTMEKMEAHYKGVLHRAFSVLLLNHEGKMLLQKRSQAKYHSAGLWTNACCSHPQPGEKMQDAARRRLKEEMGIDVPTEFAYKFIYKTALGNEMTEYEYDHVFVGAYDGVPHVNNLEVEDWKYADIDWIRNDVRENPDLYTYWFKLIIQDPQLKF